MRSKLGAVSVLMFTLILVSIMSAGPPLRGQSSLQISTVYISPITTCCTSPNVPYTTNSLFGIGVNLNLAAGQSINVFDVRINYTNPHTFVQTGVLQAMSVDYSNNIFSPYAYSVVQQCIDGQPVPASGPTCINDVVGQVHFGESILGRTLSGPLNGELFKVNFKVTGNGTSLFAVDRAEVVNPVPDPSNPQLVAPEDIPVITGAGIFGNAGVVAFFDYHPENPSVSPSLLPNHAVTFDASASFVPVNSSMGFRSYAWDFGDGSPTVNTPNAVLPHTFALPGNYTVSLNVTDDKNESGVLSREVSVLPALGNLALSVQDTSGTYQRGNVRLRLYNSSSSSTPIFNQTTDGNGLATIIRLLPGTYYLTYSGQGIVPGSKSETVIPGFTQQDTIFVTLVPRLPDYSGIIYLGTILGGLAAVTAVIIYQKARSARKRRKTIVRSSKNARARN